MKGWRINYGSDSAAEVEYVEAAGDYILVKGDSSTTYKGHVYKTPDDAFDAAIASYERSIKSNQDRIARLQKRRIK